MNLNASTIQRSRSEQPCVGRQTRPPQVVRHTACQLLRFPLSAFRSRGFTLVELMVVILIIAVLMGILIPTVASVRRASYGAKTQSIISQLAAAIEAYHQDNGAYPGPISNDVIGFASASGIMLATNPTTRVDAANGVTMSENLYLGLSGGIGYNGGVLVFDDTGAQLGKGPHTLVATGPNLNRLHAAYVENIQSSWDMPRVLSKPRGQFQDQIDVAGDTVIPEYVDGYSQPLPILYLRARTGAQTNTAPGSQTLNDNNVITSANNFGQYSEKQILGYTNSFIGEGKDKSKKSLYKGPILWPGHGLQRVNLAATTLVGDPQLNYPYDSYAYFGNPSFYDSTTGTFSQPRQKDGYILISAGADRIYGTDDDVCSFGSFNFAK